MAENTGDGRFRFKDEISETLETIQRAFSEFLFVPSCVIIGFLLLALASYALDSAQFGLHESLRRFLKSHVFANAEATSGLLTAISAGIITMTSITISLLLLAVQQSAGSMTSQVFDQFLRRKHNQFYFGFFIGLALYSLITLATVNKPFNPVFGGTISLLGTVIALYMLLILLYTTVNQMRPVEIIETIHDYILIAREQQLSFIHKTRRVSLFNGIVSRTVKTEKHGFVTRIYLEIIEAAVKNVECEVVFSVSLGSYVAFQDTIAEVKAQTFEDAEKIGKAVQKAVRLERKRDIIADPSYGIEQLETIGWTSISTSKSNPAPGLLTILSLRDVLARWCIEKTDETPLPIVYRDNTFARLMDAFETFAVVSSESMQHQNYIAVLNTFTVMFDRLPDERQPRAEDLILRILSALGDHVLTAELDAALSGLVAKLKASGKSETADAVQKAREKLALSVGKLNSRSTRVGK